VAIGRALVREAQVFLFDEPLSNLDAKLRAELRRELKLLHQKLGSTMIYVTHDQVEAMTLASRIVVMQGGAVQQVGTPLEVYERPANRFVAGFLGAPAMAFVDGALDAARRFTAGGLACVPGAGCCAPGRRQPAVLGVRPEHVAIRADGRWRGRVAGRTDGQSPGRVDPLRRRPRWPRWCTTTRASRRAKAVRFASMRRGCRCSTRRPETACEVQGADTVCFGFRIEALRKDRLWQLSRT
jgi:ABC-type sugar transport system ATPase subunit